MATSEEMAAALEAKIRVGAEVTDDEVHRLTMQRLREVENDTMKLWEARFGQVMLVAAKDRAEAEKKVNEYWKTIGGEWVIREVPKYEEEK